MLSPAKFLSSLTALSLLMTASACAEADVPETEPSLTRAEQAVTTLAVTIDEDDSATDGMRALINGKDATLDDVAKALGDQTAQSKELRAAVDGGAEALVEGATGTLSASAVKLLGFKKISESTLKAAGVRAFFFTSNLSIELRFNVLPSSDAAVNEGFAQVSEMNALLEDLGKRYPDIEKENPDTFAKKEAAQLERIATLYCLASGQKPGCAPSNESGTETRPKLLGFWWEWLIPYLLDFSKVGVIPNGTSCPSESPLVQIYHDDEDKNNANSRGGWQGGISSTNNTLMRFCKVDGRNFFPLKTPGSAYNYTVLRLHGLCPRTTTRPMVRRFDNEDRANGNWSSGPTFPNVNVLGNWVMSFCAFNGGASPIAMAAFPNVGFSYGVFASGAIPGQSLANGWLYKDDEDTFNLNFWINGPDSTMNGGGNTWMGLARVK
jgi:hypothetical protein